MDYWSAGCIVYRLIAGKGLFKNIGEVYRFRHTETPSPVSLLMDGGLCGDDCADFVGKLIIADPNRRLGATAALGHPWMLRFSETDKNTITTERRNRFVSYKAIANREDYHHNTSTSVVSQALETSTSAMANSFSAQVRSRVSIRSLDLRWLRSARLPLLFFF